MEKLNQEILYIKMSEKQARAFESIKKALAAPLTMMWPTKGCLRILYFTSTEKSIGEWLAQEV